VPGRVERADGQSARRGLLTMAREALVLRDAVDAADFAAVVAGSRALGALIEEGSRLLPEFEALMLDLFCGFAKLNVKVAEGEGGASPLRRRLVTEVLASEAFASARRTTVLRPEAAGFGALRVGRAVLAALRAGELVSAEELRSGWRAEGLKTELEEARRRQEALRQLLDAHPDRRGMLEALLDEVSEEADATEDALGSEEEELGTGVSELPREGLGRVLDAVVLPGDEGGGGEADVLGGGGGAMRDDVDALDARSALVNEPGFKRFVALLGAMRNDARALRRKRFPRAETEVYGVELGAELERLLPVELMLVRRKTLRREFLRRYAERRLLGYQMRGEDHRGRGPVVALLDVSGSMAGARGLWAKAVILTIAELARWERRPVRVMTFDTRVRAADFELVGRGGASGRRALSMEGVAALVRLGTGGGTSFAGPIADALGVLETEREFGRGDLVLVTDGEATLSNAELAEFRSRARRVDARIMGVFVGGAGEPGRVLSELCDDVIVTSGFDLAEAKKVFKAF